MSVLVTGGFGFQGKHLVPQLLKSGMEVRVISLRTPGNLSVYRRMRDLGSLRVYWSSVTPQVLQKALHGAEVFFHLANGPALDDTWAQERIHPTTSRQLGKAPYIKSRKLLHSKRVDHLLMREADLIKVLRKSDSLRKILLISSASVYGAHSSRPINERSPLSPRNMYGATKMLIEKLYASGEPARNQTLTILRPFNIFGPGQVPGRLGSFIATVIQDAKKNAPVSLHGDGSQLRDPLYIDDVIRAYALIIRSRNKLPPVINIGSGTPVAIVDIVKEVIALARSRSKIIFDTLYPDGSFYADTQKLKILGFSVRTSLHQGLKNTIVKNGSL